MKYLRGVSDTGTRLLSGQERMDSMKSWAGIEKGRQEGVFCYVMQSVRVLVSLSTVVLSIGMGPMPAIVDLWGYDVQKHFLLLLLLSIVRHP